MCVDSRSILLIGINNLVLAFNTCHKTLSGLFNGSSFISIATAGNGFHVRGIIFK